MKDLFVLTADADALAVIRSVLARHRAIGIRPVAYVIDRHTGRDSGMVKDGPELVRMQIQKSEFQKVILIWDHDGSGWESRSPGQARGSIQARLDQVTWAGRPEAIVVVAEIEEWLWHSPTALATYLDATAGELQRWVEDFARRQNRTAANCKAAYPKELFQHVMYRRQRRKPLPRDFEQIAKAARLEEWQASESFAAFAGVLRRWFPAEDVPAVP